MSEPDDQRYGDRNGAVKDAFGNQWYIPTHIKDVSSSLSRLCKRVSPRTCF